MGHDGCKPLRPKTEAKRTIAGESIFIKDGQIYIVFDKLFSKVSNMAASITTTATTLEGQALEIVREIQVAEKAKGEEFNNVVIQPDIESGTISISMILPASFGGTGGGFSMTVTEYLT